MCGYAYKRHTYASRRQAATHIGRFAWPWRQHANRIYCHICDVWRTKRDESGRRKNTTNPLTRERVYLLRLWLCTVAGAKYGGDAPQTKRDERKFRVEESRDEREREQDYRKKISYVGKMQRNWVMVGRRTKAFSENVTCTEINPWPHYKQTTLTRSHHRRVSSLHYKYT